MAEPKRTKIAYKNRLYGIRCPLSVNDGCVLFDVEAKFEVALSERVVTSFILLYSILPLCECLVPVSDGREEGLEPRIELEYGFLVNGHAHLTRKKKLSDS